MPAHMLKSNTCSHPLARTCCCLRPIAPKPTTIVDRGVKPTNHKGKHTRISCRCKDLARLPFVAAHARVSSLAVAFESYEFLNNRESVNCGQILACIPWIICISTVSIVEMKKNIWFRIPLGGLPRDAQQTRCRYMGVCDSMSVLDMCRYVTASATLSGRVVDAFVYLLLIFMGAQQQTLYHAIVSKIQLRECLSNCDLFQLM